MAESASIYLRQLKWDKKLDHSFIYRLLTNLRLTLLLIAAILITGVFALINLPRRINPEVNIPIVFVTTVYPGAGPEDVETLITDPLESAIRSVSGITKFSSSSDNVSNIVIEFTSNTNGEKAKTDVQNAVDGVTGLPEASQEPKVIRLDFEDVPVISFAVSSNSEPLSLMNFAQSMSKTLEDLPEIENVILSGYEDPEVTILISPSKLKTFGINPYLLPESLAVALATIPSGTVQTVSADLPVTLESKKDKLTLIRELPLRVGAATYFLGDIAQVSLKAKPQQPQSQIATNDKPGSQSVTFSVFKAAGADLETSAQAANNTVADMIASANGRYNLYRITDFDQQIHDQFSDLIKDFGASVILVFITLLIFLGFRQAAIASFVIPLSFLATFATMLYFDIELSFLSIFSLLLGLGMIVDDTIVMISAMTDYYSTGKFTPGQTGVLVWRDYLAPTLSSNLTNIWSFIPLLIATGIIGEFTKVISIIVTLALINSTIIALIITIPLMIAILKPPRSKEVFKILKWLIIIIPLLVLIIIFRQNPALLGIVLAYLGLMFVLRLIFPKNIKNPGTVKKARFKSFPLKTYLTQGFISSKGAISAYKAFLDRVLASPKLKRQILIAVISIAVFSYLLVPLGLVENEFFPKTNEDIVSISISLPPGTPLNLSQQEGEKVLEELRQYKEVEYALLDIGADVNLNSVNTSQTDTSKIRISLKLKEDRETTSFAFAQQLRQDYAAYYQGEFQVVEQTGGPPAGADIELTLIGDDLKVLEDTMGQVQAYLEKIPGITNITLSVKPGTSKISFEPDSNLLKNAGLSLAAIGSHLRLHTSGLKLDSVKLPSPECQDECPIVLRTQNGSFPAESLSSLMIAGSGGKDLPLSGLGTLNLQANPSRIDHLDGTRSLTVRAAVLPGFNRVKLGSLVQTYVTQNLNLPDGYSWVTGGANEENTKSVQSILQAMIIAAVLIMGTMVVELHSFKKALIVMMAIPLAISGVFILFALTGTPLSFPALIGVLALFGIVVKNSIMIVDKINRNLSVGIPFSEAVSDGAASRLEPIAFSSITSIIGLVPITISDPLWRGLGGAIIAGLTMSGLIMLLFIPVIYDLWYRRRHIAGPATLTRL